MTSEPYIIEDRGHDTPCWIWQRALSEKGYGQTRADGRIRRAHIVFYERARGPVPAGLELDHRCRVRACVNPGHLEPVTHAVNVQRGAVSRLAPEAVAAIRAEYAEGGATHRALGRKHGVSHATVGHIVRRVTWRDEIPERTSIR